MEKVSVIIPIYNAQQTIKRAVESVKAQTYENWEIILVNDGSTDDSLKICKTLVDEKIHLINKPNGGVVNAYKQGILNASGDIICFCDADDTYLPDFLERGVKIIQEHNCEFVSFGCNLIEPDKMSQEKNAMAEGFYDKESIQKEIFPHCLFNDFIPGKYYSIHVYRWTKVYKKELIMRFIDQLDENCSQLEDNIFTTLAILYAQSLYVNNSSVYNYMIGSQSMSTHYTENLIDKYTYSLSVLKSLTEKYLAEYNPRQFNFLAYENYRIAFRKIAKGADFKTAKAAIKKIRKSEFIDSVKIHDIRLLKNYLFYIFYHTKMDFLLYLCFKLL